MATNQEVAAMTPSDLLEFMGTDAEKWTQAFLVHTDLANAGPDFYASVHGWFANAVETGRTAGFSSLYNEMRHSASNWGIDTSEAYTPGGLLEMVYKEIPGDHQCL